MRLLVTGAGGFLGQYVVAEAVQRGHEVRALVRPSSRLTGLPESWQNHPQLEIVRGDLRARGGIGEWLDGVDAVIHLAAAKTGDVFEQFAGTVIATENLLSAMDEAGVEQMVLTSSFAVYEYLDRWSWSVLDESSPLAREPRARDAYCQTKLFQESLVRDFGSERGWRVMVLRPGVIFGRDNFWTARAGMQLGDRLWIRTGAFAPLPLTYVENCAHAAVLASEYDGPQRELVANIVDNHLPSQRTFVQALKRHALTKPWVVPVPWSLMRGLARLAWLTNRLAFGGNAKVPGILSPASLHARCKPLRYTNAKATAALDWQPLYTWREGLERSFGSQCLTDLPAGVRPVPAPPAQMQQPA